MDKRIDAEADSILKITRAYLQAIIDQRGYTVAAIDAYADRLANQWYYPSQRSRLAARTAMEAFIDGYEAGHNAGFVDGIEEGHAEARRDLQP